MVRTLKLSVLFILFLSGCKVVDEIKKELYVKISTDDVTGFSYTAAVVGGNVADDGGKAITEKGICYGTTPGPTTGSTKKSFGSGLGSFSGDIQNLTDNTTYYCRAYCINALGTSYGEEKSFTTKNASLPTVITNAATDIQSNQFTISLKVTSDGGSTLVGSGFYYSLNPVITLVDKTVNITNSYSVNTVYSATINGLLENTTYYVAAFSRNGKGVSLGNTIAVKTNNSPTKTGLTSGLQLFYSFSGGNANDDSGKGFNGIPNGLTAVADRNGSPNSAFSFDGLVGKNITTNYFGISGYKSRSISFWFKIPNNTIGNHSHILTYGGNPFLGENYFSIFVSSLGAGKPYIGIMSGGYVGNQFASIQDNNWHHCVVTLDEAALGAMTSIKMYLDSKNVSFDVSYLPNKINNLSTLPLVLGQFTSLTNDPRPFKGSIDDLGIWNRVLSDTEIQYLFQNNYKP